AVALGQLVAGGALREQDVEGLLTQAAFSIGLRPMETARTIASGLRAGARRPRTVAA
ncbi:DNA primase, partial [Catellatospora sp. KI3]|nr:DNA primase [Catellatospora sp. KI3]